MKKITALAFVALPVNDLKAARHFYEELLGLKLTHSFMDCWFEYDLGDACLVITKADADHPAEDGSDIKTIPFGQRLREATEYGPRCQRVDPEQGCDDDDEAQNRINRHTLQPPGGAAFI